MAEWQTRKAQDLVGAIPWGFKSPLSHHRSNAFSRRQLRLVLVYIAGRQIAFECGYCAG